MFEVTEYDEVCDRADMVWSDGQLVAAVDGKIRGFMWVDRERWVVELGGGVVLHVVLVEV